MKRLFSHSLLSRTGFRRGRKKNSASEAIIFSHSSIRHLFSALAWNLFTGYCPALYVGFEPRAHLSLTQSARGRKIRVQRLDV